MFTIRPRRAWRANAPRSTVRQSHRTVHTIVIHHTTGKAAYTLKDAIQEMREMQRFHQHTRGWSDIGYNFVIDRRGRVWEGRGYDTIGAHTLNNNTGTIGVSFMGNYENIKPTMRQLAALRMLRIRLRTKGFRIRSIKGHQQMPQQSTACPGRHLMKALKL